MENAAHDNNVEGAVSERRAILGDDGKFWSRVPIPPRSVGVTQHCRRHVASGQGTLEPESSKLPQQRSRAGPIIQEAWIRRVPDWALRDLLQEPSHLGRDKGFAVATNQTLDGRHDPPVIILG